MNKELTPLEALNDLINVIEDEHIGLSEDKYVFERKNTIETALKEYEGAKTHIEALHKERVETSLKLEALEIIIKKGVDVRLLKGCKYVDTYNDNIGYDEEVLTDEEFDLLKEVVL